MRSFVSFVCAAAIVSGCSAKLENQNVGPNVDAGPDASDGAPPADAGPDAPLPVPQVHRATASPCPAERGAGGVPATSTDGGVNGGCTRDDECTSGLNGRCVGSHSLSSGTCSYDACASDGDCSGDTPACQCGATYSATAPRDGNVCVPAQCLVDSDCGPGGYCSPSLGFVPCAVVPLGFFCHTHQDTCTDDAQCNGQRCVFEKGAGHWQCEWLGCAG